MIIIIFIIYTLVDITFGITRISHKAHNFVSFNIQNSDQAPIYSWYTRTHSNAFHLRKFRLRIQFLSYSKHFRFSRTISLSINTHAKWRPVTKSVRTYY